MPHASTRKIEQRPWYPVGRDAGDAAEDDHVHDHRQSGLHDKPDRAEDGLLVLCDYVSLDEKGDEIPVLPEFLKINLEEAGLRLDDSRPLPGFLCLFHRKASPSWVPYAHARIVTPGYNYTKIAILSKYPNF